MLELHGKSKGVVEPTSLLLKSVLEVTNVLSIPVPPNATALFSFLLGVDEWLHTLVVRTLVLDEIYEVEFVVDALLHVGHSEVVPLGVGGGAVVVLQDHVVLILSDLDCSAKVSRLKPTFEDEGVVLWTFFLVKCLQL